jgi:hypothetical protein
VIQAVIKLITETFYEEAAGTGVSIAYQDVENHIKWQAHPLAI